MFGRGISLVTSGASRFGHGILETSSEVAEVPEHCLLVVDELFQGATAAAIALRGRACAGFLQAL